MAGTMSASRRESCAGAYATAHDGCGGISWRHLQGEFLMDRAQAAAGAIRAEFKRLSRMMLGDFERLGRALPRRNAARRPRTLTDLLTVADQTPAAGLAHFARLSQRMSHELRTPLNAVLGFSEIMASEVFGPLGDDRYRAYAHDINVSGRKLLKSAEDALAITTLLTTPRRLDRLQTLSPAAIWREALAFHGAELASRAADVRTDFDVRALMMGDAQAIRQILVNLVAEGLARSTSPCAMSVSIAEFGDDLALSIGIDRITSTTASTETSFSLLLARTLAEMTGARIEESMDRDGRMWRATALVPRAAQHDFFLC